MSAKNRLEVGTFHKNRDRSNESFDSASRDKRSKTSYNSRPNSRGGRKRGDSSSPRRKRSESSVRSNDRDRYSYPFVRTWDPSPFRTFWEPHV
jgi:hypothetical protein